MLTEQDVKKCMQVVDEYGDYIANCNILKYFPMVVESAKGAILTDLDGNEFIDFLSSASSLNMGSTNPVVTEAMHDQVDKVTQFANAYTYNRLALEYAKRLTSVFPGGGDNIKICFGNCGSDGNDAAVKLARGYTGRTNIMVFQNGYHGSTYGSISMTTCSENMRKNIGPFLPGVHVFPFYGSDMPDDVVEAESTKVIEMALASYMPASETAACIIEPVQGDAGILPAHPIFIKKLYKLCKDNGILFISEEVQQAFYRTGKFFGIEHYDIVPDGIIMGKSIGAGTTLGAFMARAEIMDSLPAPAHLFTLGGNHLACRAGIAAFDFYQTEDFQKHLAANIELIEKLAADLKAKHPDVIDFYRNLGMSMGIGVKGAGGESTPDALFKILFRSYQYGLCVISLSENVLRIQPPLTITKEELTKGFEIMSKAIDDLVAGDIPDSVFRFRGGW